MNRPNNYSMDNVNVFFAMQPISKWVQKSYMNDHAECNAASTKFRGGKWVNISEITLSFNKNIVL